MNKSATIFALVGLPLSSLYAQTVPLYLNYQGKITGGSGVPVGSSGTAPNFIAAPENRKIIFRLFDAQTGGNRLWSEQQTVTVSLGEFSVLLGQGTAAVYNALTESRPALDTVFTSGGAVGPAGPTRFLEMIVDDGDGTLSSPNDLPVAPRQRITTSAYSFRARMADAVPAGAIDGTAIGAGAISAAKILDGAVTTEKIADLAVGSADLANNSVNSAKIADASIVTADLADNSVTTTKIPDSSITTAKILDATVGNADLANNSVTSIKIADGNILTADLADNSVTTGKIPDSAITGAKILDGTIGTAEIANGAVTAAKMDLTGIGVWPTDGPNVYRPAGSNVGIGVAAPAYPLAFQATTGDKINLYQSTGPGVPHYGLGIAPSLLQIHTDQQISDVAFGWGSSTAMVETMRIKGNGFVGIGTSNPSVKLDVVGLTTITMVDNGYQSNTNVESPAGTHTATGILSANGAGIEVYGMSGGGDFPSDHNFVAPVSIRSEGWIASGRGITVYSDRRIKRDIHESVTAQDLAAIGKLKVTDYRMVDPADGGKAWRKGFIAQEVEKVIPGAVTRSVEFVPDIFATATTTVYDSAGKTLAITLAKDHGLKTGARVRLHVDGNRLDLNVSAVPSAREFVVEGCEQAPQKVLVYGQQVSDFRTVDYDRIFTTSVGALQELKREKDAEVKALQDRIAALEEKDKARDVKLAAIEKMLESGDGANSETRPVVLKTVAGAQ